MKMAIMGSRSLDDKELIHGILNDTYETDESKEQWVILGGGAVGADRHIADWAREQSLDFVKFEPHHRLHTSVAFDPVNFFIRNKAVVRNADAVIAIWDGVSTDVKHVIEYAEKLGKPLTVVTITEKVREDY